MEFSTKIAMVVADDLEMWQKLNVISFLSSGIIANEASTLGELYKDASGVIYCSLCIQPIVILQARRERLSTFLQRANSRGVRAAIYIQDMFVSAHDQANRATVAEYITQDLPLVGMAIRADKKDSDKILKGARLHD
jgi:hypothetical protein